MLEKKSVFAMGLKISDCCIPTSNNYFLFPVINMEWNSGFLLLCNIYDIYFCGSYNTKTKKQQGSPEVLWED